MLYALSDTIEDSMLTELKASDHIAIMFDETTDCTVTEQLAIHCHYIQKTTGRSFKVLLHESN